MQIVTLSLYHFAGPPAKLWAFSQMGLMRPAVARMEGLRFYKMMGTGAGAGFSTTPDLSTYTLLCVWDDMAAARKALDTAEPFARYRARADRSATLLMAATQTRGQWSGAEPFAVDAGTRPQGPIVALTRATLRWSKLAAFWSLVPAISDMAEADAHQHFMMGMGEVPYKHQMTFSIWDDEAAMRDFSLNSPTHGTAVRRAWNEGWFAESLFARFNLLGVEGAWPGLERFASGAEPVTDDMRSRQAA
ncbi:MAG: spheroidene monooxygenase [Oricola sp.]|nr:MAG: spheroidene monooxygenase [Oricola sp.]